MGPVWMSELSARSGVPVATIKYYLREQLLPPGEATGATRARYDEGHVRRLRLVRALVEVGGMGLERVRRVLAAVDDESLSVEESIGAAHTLLSPEVEATAESRERVAAWAADRGWLVSPDSRHARALAAALDAMAAAGQPMSDELLGTYVHAAWQVARADLARVGDRDATDATTFAVIGTVLTEPVLLSLRRMAQVDVARSRGVGAPDA